MIDRRSRLARIAQVEIPILAIIGFALAPYLWMILTSIKPARELAEWPVHYLPREATLDHYRELITRTSFAGNLSNSLIIACGAALAGLAVSIPAGYAFSRFRFGGRRLLMTGFLAINMFPIVLLIIPLFLLMRALGLLDTYLGVIAGHSTFAIPFAIWMLTSYFNTIPRELDEAAMMDGCGPWRIYWRIVLPLSAPVLATAAIFTFIFTYDDFLGPLIYLNDMRDYTVPLALRSFVDATGESRFGQLFAMSTLSLIPVFLVFVFYQRLIIRGITLGALKS